MYIVKKGDTLTSIANKNGCTVEQIIKLNSIKNKNLIFVGQKLKLKNTPTPTPIQNLGGKVGIAIVNKKGEPISNFKWLCCTKI